MIPLPTIYHGAVINPRSLTEYDAFPNCLLAVSPAGDIAWMVEDVQGSMVQEVMSQKGCIDADVINLKFGEFIIPGFVDTHTVSEIVFFPYLSLIFASACSTTAKHGNVKFALMAQCNFGWLISFTVAASINYSIGCRNAPSLWSRSLQTWSLQSASTVLSYGGLLILELVPYLHPVHLKLITCQTTTCCYYGTLHLEATKKLADILNENGKSPLFQ